MLEPQKDGESAFSYLDRLAAEEKRVRLAIQAVRGGSYKGRKPNGSWYLTFRTTRRLGVEDSPDEVVEPTPVALIQRAATLRCASCGCPTDYHGTRELDAEEAKGKRRKDRKRCSGTKLDGTACPCAKLPEEIRAAQGSPEWIAKRLAAKMMERETPGWREVSAATLYEGIREDGSA